jgi:hypothetical protein
MLVCKVADRLYVFRIKMTHSSATHLYNAVHAVE